MSFSITVVAADLKNLSYWHSDKDKIGHWCPAPIVVSTPLSPSFSTTLQSGISKAQSEWGKAGIYFNYISNSWAYNIICYGGTPDELIAAGIQEDFSGITGRTKHTQWDVYEGNYRYGSTLKKGYSMTSAVIYILDLNRPLAQVQKTTIHEFGHAMGWFGHSLDSANVMCQGGTSITQLTTTDKQHLQQIYQGD